MQGVASHSNYRHYVKLIIALLNWSDNSDLPIILGILHVSNFLVPIGLATDAFSIRPRIKKCLSKCLWLKQNTFRSTFMIPIAQ